MTKQEIYTTIVFLRHRDMVLLGMKKRGFGMGRWNGIGGKRKPNEPSKICAKREVLEEIGVHIIAFSQVAEITFYERYDGTPSIIHSDVYICTQWEGEPIETAEIRPQWFSREELPFKDMWSGDALWLPRLLQGERLCATLALDATDTVTHATVERVDIFMP